MTIYGLSMALWFMMVYGISKPGLFTFPHPGGTAVIYNGIHHRSTIKFYTTKLYISVIVRTVTARAHGNQATGLEEIMRLVVYPQTISSYIG